MTIQRIHPPTDETLRALAAEQAKQTALLSAIADKTPRAAMLDDWDQAAAAIQADLGEYVFPIASQFIVPWKTRASSSADEVSYDAAFDVMHHGEGALADGETLKVMHAQMHLCLPFDSQISNYQAFLKAVDGLPAGTYHVEMGFSWGAHVVSGKKYQFTLTQPLPAGGVLCGFRGAPDQAPSNWRVYSYASNSSTTEIETCVVTEGSGGVSLGTFTAAGVTVPASGTPASTMSITVGGTSYACYGINSLHRTAYGNNRWLHSAIRQYLNSEGHSWWTPMTVFDRPPAYADRQGFLSGLPDDLRAHLRPIARKTALSYLCDGGTAGAPEYDTTYDLVTLPSALEHNLADNADFGGGQGKEGPAWEYWKRAAGSALPLGWWQTHPEYIQYDLSAPTAARYVWMRSAGRGYGYHVAIVYSSGRCTTTTADNGYRVAPACAIG